MSVRISSTHYFDGCKKMNAQKLAEKISVKAAKIMSDEGMAVFYINGCSYYLQPINNSRYGFGSGELEIVFRQDDKAKDMEKKLTDFLIAKGEFIYYGGCDANKVEAMSACRHTCWREPNAPEKTECVYEDEDRCVELTSAPSAIGSGLCYHVGLKEKSSAGRGRFNKTSDREKALGWFNDYCAF